MSSHLPSLALLALVPMVFMGKQYRGMVLFVVASMVVAWMVARGIREFMPTYRPFMLGIGFQGLDHAKTASFPSMHATVAGAWAAALCLACSRNQRIVWALAAAPVACLIAWSRVFLGLHFPLDIFAGLTVGFACTLLTRRLIQHGRVILLRQG